MQSREAQFKHTLKKKESEADRMKERLHQLLVDKTDKKLGKRVIIIIIVLTSVFSELARVRRSPLIPILQSTRFCASSPHKLTRLMSSSTHCIQIFLLLPLHLWLPTARSLHLDDLSLRCASVHKTYAASVHTTEICHAGQPPPPLPHSTFQQHHTRLSVPQRHATHPSNHHSLCPLQSFRIVIQCGRYSQ